MFIKIRQQKVIDALKKLKQIHCYYNEVTLDESAKFDNSTQNVHIPNNIQKMIIIFLHPIVMISLPQR